MDSKDLSHTDGDGPCVFQRLRELFTTWVLISFSSRIEWPSTKETATYHWMATPESHINGMPSSATCPSSSTLVFSKAMWWGQDQE